ncbi:MAG TPA: MarR family winged helix-turn-helix transcriptional regulator [Burkholderiales bacterium]|nr:MarR family winged helix-turn-helix transcriptional regulator [Burkholderiales bacterium]
MPAAFDLDSHVFYWLTQVIGARDRELTQGLREFGLRVPEWRALAALYARQRCTMSELAELATIDRTTLTRTVDRMQAAGWLSRLADGDDMRVTRLELTAAGRKLFDRVWPTAQRLNELALAGLSKPEIQQLHKTLERMRSNLEDYVSEGETHAS